MTCSVAWRARWFVLLVALLVALAGCSRPQLFHQEAYVFGTRVDLTVYGVTLNEAETAMGAVLREFDRIHHAYHAWQSSELTRLNEALAQGQSYDVSEELAELLRDVRELAAMGDHLFDPALGGLIELWGFHDDEFEPRLPDEDAVAALLAANPRMSDVRIDGTVVSSDNPAVQIDLGGYAKGFALDRAAIILRHHGLEDALINIGGNIMAMGSKGGTPWRVGVQHPQEPRPLATMPLYDGEAIGTSGDYQRFFEIDGQRFSHLLDPRTGRPATGTQSLTVLITPREAAGTWSDAASKAPFIADDDAWRDYLRRYDIDHALRVATDGTIEVTRELRARLQIPSGIGPVTVID